MRDGIGWMTGWNEALCVCVPQAAAATGWDPRARDTLDRALNGLAV